jgi:hypothetical protein
MPPFDDGRRSIWLQHVWNTCALKVVCRDGAGKIAARVQMSDVEVTYVMAQELSQTDRKKSLLAIREAV